MLRPYMLKLQNANERNQINGETHHIHGLEDPTK